MAEDAWNRDDDRGGGCFVAERCCMQEGCSIAARQLAAQRDAVLRRTPGTPGSAAEGACAASPWLPQTVMHAARRGMGRATDTRTASGCPVVCENAVLREVHAPKDPQTGMHDARATHSRRPVHISQRDVITTSVSSLRRRISQVGQRPGRDRE